MKVKLILSFLSLFCLLTAQVDYSSQVQQVFNSNCINCHGGSSGVTLTSYSSTMSSNGNQYGSLIVVPGDAVASPLYDKIRLDKSPDHGSRMPAGGSLTATEVDIIRDWINEGAHETVVQVAGESGHPAEFSLLGNYPNPFNSMTTIGIEMSKANQVNLQIFNSTGQEVYRQNIQLASGQNNLLVDFANRAAGIYFYQVSLVDPATDYTPQVGKLTYLK